MNNGASALIIGRPGRLRDGLQAILAAMPQIGRVDQVDDVPSALRLASNHQPYLVFLNIHLIQGELRAALIRVKSKWTHARCIVLAHDSRQQRDARAAGADGVLIAGYPAAELTATIERILPTQRSNGRSFVTNVATRSPGRSSGQRRR